MILSIYQNLLAANTPQSVAEKPQKPVERIKLATWLDTNSGHILISMCLLVFGVGVFCATPDSEARTLARDVVMASSGVLWRSMNSGQSSKPEPQPETP